MRKFKPVTPAQRHMYRLIKAKRLSQKEYRRIVREGLILGRTIKTGGRGITGRVTVRGRGGGHKIRGRVIDWKRDFGHYTIATVESLQYHPKISSKIALLRAVGDNGKSKRWNILAAEGMKPGQKVIGSGITERLGGNYTFDMGEARPIREVGVGQSIYNIDGKYIRAAGGQGIIERRWQNKDGVFFTEVVMPSGERKSFEGHIKVSIGQGANAEHKDEIYGKAGATRRRGRRPIVRGEARNPVDHPHGGKSHGSGGKGNTQRNVWGKLAKWVPTKRSNILVRKII